MNAVDTAVAEAIARADTEKAARGGKQRTLARAYTIVNALWPANCNRRMTDQEVKTAARALYKLTMGETFTGKIIVKHRGRSWMRRDRIIGNSFQGWHDVVHDWSHDAHRWKYPKETQHGPHQAPIERAMVEEVVKRGWLNRPSVEPTVKAKPDKTKLDLERTPGGIEAVGHEAKACGNCYKEIAEARSTPEEEAGCVN